jgi:hypothetical protein
MQAEARKRLQPVEPFCRQPVRRQTVDDNPDFVSAPRERRRQVADVTEQASHWSAEDLKDAERCPRHPN